MSFENLFIHNLIYRAKTELERTPHDHYSIRLKRNIRKEQVSEPHLIVHGVQVHFPLHFLRFSAFSVFQTM